MTDWTGILNPAITSSPVVLFLGAGASSALGYKTAQEFLPVAETELTPKQWSQVKAVLDSLASERIASLENPPAIEEVLLRLNEWRVATYLLHRAPIPKAIHSALTTLNVNDLKECYRRITDLRFDLLGLLARHYAACDRELAYRHYGWLFDLLMNKRSYLVVLSTNYDWSVELACRGHYHIVDGFYEEAPGFFDPDLFHVFKPHGAKTILLFRLHGSTGWYWSAGLGLYRTLEKMKVVRGKTDRVLIHPGGQMLDWYMMSDYVYVNRPYRNVNPFRTMYSYLRECLLHTRLCIVIGYSFPYADEQIREYFQQAFTVNSHLRVLWIDPAEPRLSTISPRDELVSRLQETSGLDWLDYRIDPERVETLSAYYTTSEDVSEIRQAIKATISGCL